MEIENLELKNGIGKINRNVYLGEYKTLHQFLDDVETLSNKTGESTLLSCVKKVMKGWNNGNLNVPFTKNQENTIVKVMNSCMINEYGSTHRSKWSKYKCKKQYEVPKYVYKPTKIENDDFGTIFHEFLLNLNRECLSSTLTNFIFDYISLVYMVLEEFPNYFELHFQVLEVLKEEGWDFDGAGGFVREPNQKQILTKLNKLVI